MVEESLMATRPPENFLKAISRRGDGVAGRGRKEKTRRKRVEESLMATRHPENFLESKLTPGRQRRGKRSMGRRLVLKVSSLTSLAKISGLLFRAESNFQPLNPKAVFFSIRLDILAPYHNTMLKVGSLFLLLFLYFHGFTQEPGKRSIRMIVLDEQKNPLPGSTVQLLNPDSVVVHSGVANGSGTIEFMDLNAGRYRVRASQAGYEDGYSPWVDLEKNTSFSDIVLLKAKSRELKAVTVVSKKPPIQFLPDKTVINPEASITNAGATIMDVLEKSPGITVARDGNIIMKGKPAVTVLIDGKPTQLSGADLQAYLSGISASQVDVIELIENPGAKYDASGNAGIINIKMKSNKLKGFNGSMNLSVGQGIYSKTGNSLNLNYRNGKINWFMNYGMRASREMMDMYTLRKYFNTQNEDSALLEQPNLNKSRQIGQNLKTGFDFFVNNQTTLGLVFNGGIFERKGTCLCRDRLDGSRLPGRFIDQYLG